MCVMKTKLRHNHQLQSAPLERADVSPGKKDLHAPIYQLGQVLVDARYRGRLAVVTTCGTLPVAAGASDVLAEPAR